MPSYRNVCVSIHDVAGEKLEEFGFRKYERHHEASCYIESVAGRRFQIVICLDKMPFRAVEEPDYDWHLLATLRLDGRLTPETQALVFLDKSHPYYPSDGCFVMGEKKVCGSDNIVRTHRWIFRDVGIETLLEDVELNKAEISEEEELENALQGMGADLEEKEETGCVGRIEVTLERVHLDGATYLGPERVSSEQEGSATSMAFKPSREISHTAQLDEGTRSPTKSTHYLKWYPCTAFEAPFARIKFFYRNAQVLRKYGFAGFEDKGVIPRRATFQEQMTAMSPLQSKRSAEDAEQEGDSLSRKKANTAIELRDVASSALRTAEADSDEDDEEEDDSADDLPTFSEDEDEMEDDKENLPQAQPQSAV
ncbi:Hypothetical predicted protein [Lecanosticta acicola]|uniref:DUF7918 domain-containing protein n=1 Tax=Lecanosticta acicola TaxID=111012 RepID=A0AAI8Z0P1_9PEZI|nr:Hypothetical predicted protein [Lecanosticta acicola]